MGASREEEVVAQSREVEGKFAEPTNYQYC